jgi:hypothetical protein
VAEGKPMDPEIYLREIQAAYAGEIWGAAFFEALSQQTSLAPIRDRLLMLARLEHNTRERLRPLADRQSLDTSGGAKYVADGKALAAQWAGLDRHEFSRRLNKMLTEYVVRYDALAEAATTADAEVLTYLAAHERALLVFTERELAGKAETALALVLALLVDSPEPGDGLPHVYNLRC